MGIEKVGIASPFTNQGNGNKGYCREFPPDKCQDIGPDTTRMKSINCKIH